MNAYVTALRHYATFSGRTSRAEFWRAHIVLLPLMLIASGVFGASASPRSVWPTLFFVLIVVPHVIPWAALAVRRLHDMDRAGWWVLVSLIPLVMLLPLGIVAILVWAGQRGTSGSNRYDAEPLDGALGTPAEEGPAPRVASLADEPADTEPNNLSAASERLSLLRANGTLTASEFKVIKAKALGQERTA